MNRDTSLSLSRTPVSTVKGISAKRTALLRRLGIETWYDLVTCYPRGFEDWSATVSIDMLEDGEEQTFIAAVARTPVSTSKGRLTIQKAILQDETGSIQAAWFNQPWLIQKLEKGNVFRFRGKIRRDGRFFSVQNPSFEPWNQDQAGPAVKPIYPLTEGLSQAMMRQWIQMLLPSVLGNLPEPLPAWIRKQYHLCAVDFAISRIHQPESLEEAELCRHRLAFEELFLVQGGLRIIKQQRSRMRFSQSVERTRPMQEILDRQIARLPYALTDAQKRALDEILRDLALNQPMSRLVQGDVGCGKTVIAALAMLACAAAGGQAALMAPTSVLARQHADSLQSILEGSGVAIALLTGQTPAAKKRSILEQTAAGEISLIVGTHALLEETVVFKNLLLAVTDEQHRFGVRQRSRLSGYPVEADEPQADTQSPNKAVPHVLVMSATPIPRTLALILYGDLDISVINEMPPGRQPVETYTASTADRDRIHALIRKTVQQGRQTYIVCPMIEEQAESDLKSVVGLYNHLSQEVFPDQSIGLLHGGLKPTAKEQVMKAFFEGTCQILVSTTVIEVGVDQPNAALMVIENAERFGLAQLHQLRGRIGRGRHRSICVLVSDSTDPLATSRMKTLCHSQDGFVIAEKDLELRGPGDFFGTRQHGLPDFKLVNLYRDHELIRQVSAALDELFRRDPALQSAEHRVFTDVLIERYQEAFPGLSL